MQRVIQVGCTWLAHMYTSCMGDIITLPDVIGVAVGGARGAIAPPLFQK